MILSTVLVGTIMNNWKTYALAAVIVTAAVFAYVGNPRQHIPSDLRDAVASRDFDTSIPVITDENDSIPVPKAAPAPGEPSYAQPVRDWTVMVYMNAKASDIGHLAQPAIDALEETGSTDKVNVVVEVGELNAPVKRLFIQKKAGNNSSSVVVQQFPETDMGNYLTVSDFLVWAKKNYPAKRYMFVPWGHGMGWADPKLKPEKGMLVDQKTANYVRTPELAKMFKEAGPVDVYYAFSCLMQMAETVYELKDYAKVIIGSEQTIGASAPSVHKLGLQTIIASMTENPEITPREIGEIMINGTRDIMRLDEFKRISLTLSVIDTSALNGLPAKLSAFANAVRKDNNRAAVSYAIDKALRMKSLMDPWDAHSSYVDLYDFARLVSDKSSDSRVKAAAKDLMDYIEKEVVVDSISKGPDSGELGIIDFQDWTHAKGLSIEMIDLARGQDLMGISETKYSSLALSKASHWDSFLSWTCKRIGCEN